MCTDILWMRNWCVVDLTVNYSRQTRASRQSGVIAWNTCFTHKGQRKKNWKHYWQDAFLVIGFFVIFNFQYYRRRKLILKDSCFIAWFNDCFYVFLCWTYNLYSLFRNYFIINGCFRFCYTTEAMHVLPRERPT